MAACHSLLRSTAAKKPSSMHLCENSLKGMQRDKHLNPYSTKVRFREGGREGIIDELTELADGHG